QKCSNTNQDIKPYFHRRVAAGSGGFQVHASSQAFWMPSVSASFFDSSRGTRAHGAESHRYQHTGSSTSADRAGESATKSDSPGPGGAGTNTGAAAAAHPARGPGYVQAQV